MGYSLTSGLHRALQQKPQAIATIYQGRRRTFAEFGDRVARLAGALRGLGVGAGDRVALLSLNSDRYLEYYQAVYWSGGAVNPVNTRWSTAEIAYSLDDCDTAILIVDDKFQDYVPELRTKSKVLRTLIYAGEGATPDGMLSYEDLIANTAPVADAHRSGDDLAGVFYTGGTTGFPKGVMLSHGSLGSSSMALMADGLTAEGCVGMHAAPMFHLADAAFTHAMLFRGATHVMVPAFDPVAVLRTIQDERITEALLVPTMVQMTVDYPAAGDYDLSSLQTLFYGGSVISEAVIERTSKLIPQLSFVQGYGMTELSPIATVLPAAWHTPEARKRKPRSAGRAGVGVELRVVDADDNEVSRGEVGEVIVRGPNVMLGYWNKPEETAHALRNGWMHTGDGAVMDADGFITIVDRLKDMIVSGGENVYSAEVENALAQHAAVAACAVIGVPDEKWGERVHAVVVLKAGAHATAEELIVHSKALIAGYKCPRSLEFRDALPLSGAGKILKTDLRAPFWQGHERGVA